MTVLIALITLALLAIVVLIVSGPLRRSARATTAEPRSSSGQDVADGGDRPAPEPPDELAAARAAKYREIRDAELDYRTGKLSREDYAAVDAELRAEALDILDRIERAEAGGAAGKGEVEGVRPRDA